MNEPFIQDIDAEWDAYRVRWESKMAAKERADEIRRREIMLALSVASGMACALGVVIGIMLATFGGIR